MSGTTARCAFSTVASRRRTCTEAAAAASEAASWRQATRWTWRQLGAAVDDLMTHCAPPAASWPISRSRVSRYAVLSHAPLIWYTSSSPARLAAVVYSVVLFLCFLPRLSWESYTEQKCTKPCLIRVRWMLNVGYQLSSRSSSKQT